MLSSLDMPNGTQTVQSYDALQRLTQVVNKKTGGADLNKFAYAYDNRDVRTGVQQQYGSDPLRQVNYTYDAIDQLVGENATGGTTGTTYSNAYSYDAMGNRLKRENTQGTTTALTRSSVNELNQLTSASTSVDGGPRVTGGMSYDAAGNLTETSSADGSRTLYVYDDADRLFRIEKRDAADAPLSKSEFIYDYASRKAVSQEFTYTAGAWQQTSEKRRVFDGLDVIQERDELNQVTAQLVRDGNVAGILSRSTTAGASFFGYDGGGNVTLLTDENGDEVGRYRYDAFGNTLELAGARAAENPYRFSTKELHGASGLYDFGYRFYSASLGRWINRDPIREAGGLNLYAMVGNDPINTIDSYGLRRRPKNVNPKAWAALEKMNKNTWWRVVRSYHGWDELSAYSHDIQHGKGNCGTSVSFDLSVRGRSKAEILNLLRKLPDYGFVGWYRHWRLEDGTPNFHLHIVYAWDALEHDKRNGGSKAGDQVDSWLVGKNGLLSYKDYVHHYGDMTFGEIWTKEQVRHLREGHEKANPNDK